MKKIEIDEYDFIQFERIKKELERSAGKQLTYSNVLGYLISLEIKEDAPSDIDLSTVAMRYLEDKEIYNLLHDVLGGEL